MKYTVVFSVFTLYLAGVGVLLGDWGLLLLWPALSFALVGAAYAGLGPGVFGKRPDGRLAWWALVLLGPFLLFTWIVWTFSTRLNGESACDEVVPGLWLGRRLRARELPSGVVLVVDLTAEFRVPRGLTTGRHYRCLPTLDALAPEETAVRLLIEELARHEGGVLIHCAAGHGRSA